MYIYVPFCSELYLVTSPNALLGGQKSRVAFAKITFKKPHIILLDEPSNHLVCCCHSVIVCCLLVGCLFFTVLFVSGKVHVSNKSLFLFSIMVVLIFSFKMIC